MISTVGAWSCQEQNTEISSPALLKLTRIHFGSCHWRICQPAVGVAERRVAERAPRSKATRPPLTVTAFTLLSGGADDEGADGDEAGERPAELPDGVLPPGPVDGAPDAVSPRVAEARGEADAEVVGPVPGRPGVADEAPSDGDSPEMASVFGGSYTVPDMTESIPHHDSVTAAPMASIQAEPLMNPRRISARYRAASGSRKTCTQGVNFRLSTLDLGLRWTIQSSQVFAINKSRTLPAMASVLVVEDDPFVRSALIRHLADASHVVRSVGTALEALREASANSFDVVILDLGLPDLDGSQALKMLRGITDVPVIIATARDDEAEIIRLLNGGADDYLTKPFSVEQLAARVSAVLRRSRGASNTSADGDPGLVRVGGLAIDAQRRRAELDGAPLELTRREFDLLAFLAGRPGVVVPRRVLLSEVWQQTYGDDQTIDVHLSWLRRKLGEKAASPRYLHTVRGVGVKLQAPEDPAQPQAAAWHA